MEKKNRRPAINQWPQEDRPREKLLAQGEGALSDSELLAIIISTGTNGHSALDLARQAIKRFKTIKQMAHADACDWQEIKGLGKAKSARLKAAFEIGRRAGASRAVHSGACIGSSGDVAGMLMPRMRDLQKEVVDVLFLDPRNRVIRTETVEEGTVDHCQPIIREIFEKALRCLAASLICAHNHPSGDPSPSPQDKDFTVRLAQAGKFLQIPVLDHVIIAGNRYYSFLDEGLME